eukprot:4188885-Pleurochrysis_carterae.AAC.1
MLFFNVPSRLVKCLATKAIPFCVSSLNAELLLMQSLEARKLKSCVALRAVPLLIVRPCEFVRCMRRLRGWSDQQERKRD